MVLLPLPSDILLYNGNVLTDNKGAREKCNKRKHTKSLHCSEMERDPKRRGPCVLHTEVFQSSLCSAVHDQPTVTQFLSLQAEFNSWQSLKNVLLFCVRVCVAEIHQHDWCLLAVWYQSSEMTSMSSELPCWVATLQRLTCWPPFLFCCESGDSSSSFCLLCLVLLFWNQTFTLTRVTKRGHFNISA